MVFWANFCQELKVPHMEVLIVAGALSQYSPKFPQLTRNPSKVVEVT